MLTIRYYCHAFSNNCQIISAPDNSGYYLFFCCENKPWLSAFHHVPFPQLSCQCGILLNLTFGLLPCSSSRPATTTLTSSCSFKSCLKRLHYSLTPILHSTVMQHLGFTSYLRRYINLYAPPTHNHFTALFDFVRDYPGEPAPER